MDELATTLILFAQRTQSALAGSSRSRFRGERQLLIAPSRKTTTSAHAAHARLDREAQNRCSTPDCRRSTRCDAWSTGGPDFDVTMQNCFATLMSDPQAALGAVVHDRVAGGGIHGATSITAAAIAPAASRHSSWGIAKARGQTP